MRLSFASMVLPGSLLFAAMVATVPRSARACGGCFTPPPTESGTATVVTAHRMAMAISPRQSTLWDQFAYAGDPEDFVWVLPASPEATVALADNRFFEVLEARTNVVLQGTFRPVRTSCPPTFAPSCSDDEATAAGGFFDAAAPASRDAGTPPVVVHNESTIGPYETVTVSSDDPMALLGWLQDRGYGVPDSLLPTIRYYGEMGLAFIALRLSPGEGVQRMQPVRVSTPGLSYVLPLRMIAAGVADKVGLRLFVFADDRYEAQNFPNATIAPEDVAYDWATDAFTYDALFQDALASSSGRTWVTSYAGRVPVFRGESMRDSVGPFTVDDDLAVALDGIETPTLTRLEASLGVAALDRDLLLSLAEDAAMVGNLFTVTRELNRPPDVVCPPPPEADCGICAVSNPGASTSRRGVVPALALLGLAALAHRVRRLRRRLRAR
ncbi:MAG: DUF2330 domain-containing protein [Deltaproteobacteria bacterium]|nr:DUF2330 domain-containing protein [Deltaproteobacteria bacterium]